MTNKQQLALSGSFVIIATSILLISLLYATQAQLARAIGTANPIAPVTNFQQKLAQVPSQSNYHLQDPGTLPIHPLYKVKMVRDRLLLVTTKRADKKAVLLHAIANTRLASAERCAYQAEIEAAVSVATKGIEYHHQAIEAGKTLTPQEQRVYFQELMYAAQKYEEVLKKLEAVTQNGSHDQVSKLLRDLAVYQEQINSYLR